MYSIIRKLSVIFLLLVSFQTAWAQIDTTILTLNDQIACPGDTVLIPVTVENFSNVTGVQFFVNWDETQLQYVGACDVAIGDPNSVVQEIANDPGALSIFWFEFINGSEVSLPDGDTLMVFKMVVLDINANGIPINISQSGPQPAEIVVFDNTGSFQFFTPNINNGMVTFNNNVNVMAFAESLTCTDTIASLSASANNPSTIYEWIGPDGFTATSEDTLTTTAGIYTLVGVDGNCVDTTMVEVVLDTIPPMNIVAMGDTIDCNNPTISIEGTSSDNFVNFSWVTPALDTLSGPIQMINQIGQYELIAQSATNGCIAMDTIEIIEDVTSPEAAIMLDGGITCISDSVILNVETVIANTSYEWTNQAGNVVSSTDSFTAFMDGSYTLTATDTTNGCFTIVDTLIVADTDAPFVSFAGLTQLSCNIDTLSLTGNSFEPNVTFQWVDSNDNLLSDSAEVIVTTPGFYEIQGTNPVNGCVGTETVEIVSDFAAPIPTIGGTGTTLNCVQDFQVLEGQSDVGLSTFEWTDIDGNVLDMDNEFIVDSSGVYNLTVTSLLNGCDSTINITIVADTIAPDLNFNIPQDLSCFLTQTSLSVSSTAPNTLCNWDDFGPNCDIFVDAPGTYTATITNIDNGCNTTDSITVNQVSEPYEIFPTVDVTIDCENTSANLSLTEILPDVLYTWVNELGDTIGTGNTIEIMDGGLYVAQAVDTLTNCPSENSVFVDQNEALPIAFIDVLGAQLDCVTDSLALNATTGPNTVLVWEDAMGNALDSNIVTMPGTYYAVLTDTTSSCTGLDSIEVQSNVILPDVALSFGLDSIITCVNTEVELTATVDPNVDVTWVDSMGMVVSFTNILNTSNSGTYTAIVFNPINNCTNIDSLEVLESIDEPEVMIEISNSINCQLNEATVSASSSNVNLVFDWVDEFGMPISTEDNFITSDPGTYEVTVLDTTNNCSVELDAFVVGSLVSPEIEYMGDTVLTCQQDTLSLNGSSINLDVVFQWLDAQGNVIADQIDAMITTPGTYSLVGLDTLNFCDSLIEVTITESVALPDVDIVAERDTLDCLENTSLLQGSTNLAQASISWTDENGNELANSLEYTATEGGTYFLTILDESNSCDSTLMIEIAVDTIAPDIILNEPNPLSCTDSLTTLEITSNTAGIECSWEGIANDCTVEVNEAGMYTATVTNPENGCEATAEVEVVDNSIEIVATPEVDGIISCENQTVNLSSGGIIGNTTYTWTNEMNDTIGTSPMIETTESGMLTLTLFDLFSGCSGSATIEVMVDTIAPSTEVSVNGQIDCNNQSASLEANPETGIDVSWVDANNNPVVNLSVTQGGVYYATFTNPVNGCEAIDSVSVIEDTEEPSLTLEIDGNDLITCLDEEVILIAQSDDGVNYSWTDEMDDQIGTNSSQSIMTGGVYTVVVVNPDNGCSATASQEILEDTQAPIANIVVDIPFDCGEQEASISTTENPNYTYEWDNTNPTNIESPQAAQTFIFEPGIYNLLVTDTQNGCTTTESITVEGGISDIVGFDLLVDQPDCNAEIQVGNIQVLNILGGTGPYVYTFQGEEFGDKNTYLDLQPGTYQLSVMDINGCTADTTILINESNPHSVTIVAEENPLRLGEEVNLSLEFNVSVNTIASITWFRGDSLICNGCDTWSESLMENTVYTVLTTDINGCTSEDIIEIFISRQREVFMPNVFSPNEDGFNDILFVQGGVQVNRIVNYEIFDRWGGLVFTAKNFQANDQSVHWDGTQNGQEASLGVYVYLIEVEYIDGETVIFSGDVTLMR